MENQNPRPRRKRFHKPSFRFTYIWIIGLLVIVAQLLTDPDTGLIRELPFGAGTIATLLILARGVLYASLLHFTFRGLLSFFDAEEAWHISREESQSTGLYMIGAGLYAIAMAIVIYAATTH